MKMQNYVYHRKLQRNVLVVGRTNYGKTHFVQKLAANNFFGKLIQAEWVSQISLSQKREAELQSSFDCALKFHYPKIVNEFDSK